MRVLAFLFLLVSTAHADTVWNVKVGNTELHTLETDPNVLFPKCRCVAGVWHKKGESAKQFTGTLDALSFNHPRKAAGKAMTVKLRKTRAVMGVHRDYRDELTGILGGSGQLVLQEVSGGEWEVVGFAAAKVGDLFASHSSWRAKAPEVAKPSPLVDNASDAVELAKIINDYRASIKLPRVPISKAMTKVAQAHVHDLSVNKPVSEKCNMHSWSTKGSWSGCCYDGGKAAARCMWAKPKEIAGYKGAGYEIAASASGITAEKALVLWQKSPAHHAVMINKDQWNKPWKAMGVAVEGDYAVAWFGEDAD